MTVTIDNNTINLYFLIYKGHRVPISSATMYNASVGKQKEDITLSSGCATIAASTDSMNGIGFKYTLPDGKKLDQYKSVLVSIDPTNGTYPCSLYMPANGWDTDAITCTESNSKLARRGGFLYSLVNLHFQQTNLLFILAGSNRINQGKIAIEKRGIIGYNYKEVINREENK